MIPVEYWNGGIMGSKKTTKRRFIQHSSIPVFQYYYCGANLDINK